jgi:hypothetical protein
VHNPNPVGEEADVQKVVGQNFKGSNSCFEAVLVHSIQILYFVSG